MKELAVAAYLCTAHVEKMQDIGLDWV